MAEPCNLCNEWPGGLFDMSRPCCFARWLKRLPAHVDRKPLVADAAETKGADFINDTRAMWNKVD